MNHKNKILLAALVAALIVSMLGTVTAFADDGTPPPDAPTTEEVLPPPVEDAPAPEADAEQVPAEDLSAALEQLPADSGLLVLDASGDAVPLASNEAAEIIAGADPYFWDGSQYVGYTSGLSCPITVNVCNTGVVNPISATVAAFAGTPAASGAIYVEAGTYNENVSINGVANLSGLQGAGSGVTTLNGSISLVNMNAFTLLGFTVNGEVSASSNSGTLQLTDLNVTNPSGDGISVANHSGDIILANVNSSGNKGIGAYLNNTAGSGTITLTGKNIFNNNGEFGLNAVSKGDININSVTANGSDKGAYLSTPGNVTLSGANVFSGNTTDGLYLVPGINNATVNATITNNGGSGIVNNVGGILTLNCVTFGGNGTNISGPGNMVDACAGARSASAEISSSSAFICPPPVVKTLPNGDKVIFFCKTTGNFSTQSTPQEKLPTALDGTQGAFISSLIAGETENSATKPFSSTIKVSFAIPADMKDANLAILYWDGSKWVEVGGQRAGAFFEVAVNFTGTFVLVKK